jgi:segregation and condensation protein A
MTFRASCTRIDGSRAPRLPSALAERHPDPDPRQAELVQPYPVHVPQFDDRSTCCCTAVRKEEIDLRDIPVADICRQYHDYLVLMVELDLEVAGSSSRRGAPRQIRNQLVLPRTPAAEGAADPREELVARLLQYRKFKGVAETLHVYEVERIGMYPRPSYKPEAEPEEEETDLSDVSLFDLLTLFKGAVDRFRALHPPEMAITQQRFSIREKMQDMTGRIRESGRVALSEVFGTLSGRAEAIAVFLAVLELLRLLLVRALQAEEFGEIYLEPTGENLTLEGYEEEYR